VNRYAGAETRHLVETIAAQEGVSPDMVVIGVGSSPILRAVGDYFATEKPGGELITATATFEVQYRAVEARGGKVIAVPFDSQLRYDVDAMASKINANTCGIYICNPNNPTGTVVPTDKMRGFVREAAKKTWVFVDEAYIDMTDDYPNSSMIDLVRAGQNVIVCRTFSKLHGLAAARCGYAIMPAALAAKVRGTLSSGGLPRLAIVAATASLADTANQAAMKVRLKRGRDRLIAMADSLKLTYAPSSAANFIYVKTNMSTKDFTSAMKAKNVLVVQRGFPKYDDWNRICVGFDEEIEQCRLALKQVMNIA
jgi:histidinol-phosphate aminotransferase